MRAFLVAAALAATAAPFVSAAPAVEFLHVGAYASDGPVFLFETSLDRPWRATYYGSGCGGYVHAILHLQHVVSGAWANAQCSGLSGHAGDPTGYFPAGTYKVFGEIHLQQGTFGSIGLSLYGSPAS